MLGSEKMKAEQKLYQLRGEIKRTKEQSEKETEAMREKENRQREVCVSHANEIRRVAIV